MKNLFLTILFSATLVSAYANVINSPKTTTPPHASADIKIKTDDPDTNKPNIWHGKEVLGADWILVLSPIALFVISVLAINYKTQNYKLEDALTEAQYPKITKPNPLYTVENLDKLQASIGLMPLLTPTIDVSDTDKGFPKSSCRY